MKDHHTDLKSRKPKISQAFQRWLLILVIVAFLATTAFLWIIQTRLAENNAINLLRLNISDVREDIIDASDENLLELTWQVAEELNRAETIDAGLLLALTEKTSCPSESSCNALSGAEPEGDCV